jgi:PAS domain S-box-containing protein
MVKRSTPQARAPGTGRILKAKAAAEAQRVRSSADLRTMERYSAFLEHTSEGIWCCEIPDPVPTDLPADEQIRRFFASAVLSDCNDAMARMYGFGSAKDLIGMRLSDMLVPSDPSNIEFLRAFIRSGYRLQGAESHERDREGKPKFFLNSLHGVVENGLLVRGWGMQRDITAEKLAERDSRESAERLRLALEAAQLGMWDFDPVNGTLQWSDRCKIIYGLPLDAAVDYDLYMSAIHPDDRDTVRANVQKAMERESGVSEYAVEHRIIGIADGQERWVSGHGHVFFDETGRAVRFIGTVLDITEQRKIEHEARQLNEELEKKVAERTSQLEDLLRRDRVNIGRLRAMIRYLPMAAVALDEWNVILEVNELFSQFFRLEYAPEDLIGHNKWEFEGRIRESILNVEEYGRQFAEMLEAKKPLFSYVINLRDGRILLRDYLPVYDGDRYCGQLLLYRDVTQERRIDATKSEFMSLASHQLRTPLTAIRWTFGRLRRSLAGRATDQELHLLHEGKISAAHMSETIDTMLAISRIESGSIQPRHVRVRLRDVLREAADVYQEDSARKEQRFGIECDVELLCETDPQFLKEIVGNLVGNAIKYTPHGGAVTVHAELSEESVHIRVTDTGYGIPRHQRDKIFRKFFRGENVVHRETEGSGLGLYLASLMAGLLGGTLSFESEEGKGTTFALDLPLGAGR